MKFFFKEDMIMHDRSLYDVQQQSRLWWQKVAKNGVGAVASSDMDTDMDSDSAAIRSIFWDPSQQNH
jgi:hypothetical protein